jgi:Spy/CpxP family protein refolding chaperone
MHRIPLLLAFAVVATAATAQQHDPSRHGQGPSPYAGEQRRAIKALSDDEVRQLLEGHGAGLARPAELNHYPGPRHVLDLAPALELTPQQDAEARRVFARMHARATALGRQLVDGEREIEAFFASGQTDTAALSRLLEAVGRLQAELRLAHLEAHVAMRRLLSPRQVARYDELRGYLAP